MGKLFVIIGKSATGKDTVFRKVREVHPDLKQVVSYTTRPIRAGETHGREYFFCSREELYELKSESKVIECREYSTVHGPWFYFTVDDGRVDLKKGDYIMISTLEGYRKIKKHFGRSNTIPIYIVVEDFERMRRSLEREAAQDAPCVVEVCRRFLADEADFSEEKLEEAGVNHMIYNSNLPSCVNEVLRVIKNAR